MLPSPQAPIFGSVSPWLARLPRERFASCDELNALLSGREASGEGKPIRFTPADAPLDEPYETRILRTGCVPTRSSNAHDFFNALAWLAFPRTKAVLNRLHCEALASSTDRGRRGTPRDVLSLFDEGGLIVASDDLTLLDRLRSFEFKALFWAHRAEVLARMRFFVVGHAILEKALEPYKAVTAKALLLHVPAGFLSSPEPEQREEADRCAAEWFLQPAHLASTRNLAPVPILGVPGWADNGSPGFYDDPLVFRSGRSLREMRAP